jgi:hypothetical protein
MNKYVNAWSMNLWMNECHMNFISPYKFVFQMCFQCIILVCKMYKLWMISITSNEITNLWMNECHTNFISPYKFMFQMCFQCTILVRKMYKLWNHVFCTISIIKIWNVKFMT